jgi:hypothetical protein
MGSANHYFAGRRGRCFVEMDLLINLLVILGSNGVRALVIALSINF